MWRMLLVLLALSCSGDDSADTGRTPCEQSCFATTLQPCRDNCDVDCGEDNQCRDTCHGDCIGEYDACLVDTCE